MQFGILATFFLAVTFCVVTRAHESVHPIHLLICAFSLEHFLPCLSILDCKFGNLVIIDEFVLVIALSIIAIVTFALALATSSFLAAIWIVYFLCLCDGLPLEIGWEGYVEAVKGYQHVEFAEVDELHIVVFAIVTPATFVKEEVYQFIGGEEDFCIKVFVTRDAAFILKIFLLILSTNRQSWLVRMLDSLKMYLLASV